LEESGVCIAGDIKDTKVEQYLKKQFHRGNLYVWQKDRFPRLSILARKYLAPPPTSAASEHLFTTAGDIYDEKRNRLAPERAEAVLFIKKSFSVVGGNNQY